MKKNMMFLLIIFLFVRLDVVYADVSASISVSTTETVVGNSGKATLTINGNGEHFGQIYGTFSCEGLGNKDLTFTISDSAPTSRSYVIEWTAKSVGTYTCSVSGVQVGLLEHPDKGLVSVSAASKKINVIGNNSNKNNQSGGGQSSGGNNSGGTTADKREYDSNNDLKSLSIDGYQLNPSFSKDVLEYKLEVDESVEKINISARASSDKATVHGGGDVNLTQGENTIQVKVEAENGNEKIYKIIVTVKDQHPIKVIVDTKEYTVVKKNNDIIKKIDYYDEEVIKIDDQDVVSYVNPNTKVRLVILKDSDNKVGFYIYNDKDKSYSLYKSVTVGNVTLQLLNLPSKLVNFKKYSVKINDIETDFYKIKKSNQVGLIYGTNVKNGNTGYYVYDTIEDTLSRYYDEEVKLVNGRYLDFKNQAMIFIGVVSGVALISLVINIIQTIKRRNRRKIN